MPIVYTNGKSFYHYCRLSGGGEAYSALYTIEHKMIICVYEKCDFILPSLFYPLINIPDYQFFLGKYADKELPEKDCLPYEIR